MKTYLAEKKTVNYTPCGDGIYRPKDGWEDEELLAELVRLRQHYMIVADKGTNLYGRLFEHRVLEALRTPLSEAELEQLKYSAKHAEADVQGLFW